MLHERLSEKGTTLTNLRSVATVLTIAVTLTAISACGGPAADGASALLEVVPASAEVAPGEILKFAATGDESVTWGVMETNGGAIDGTGVYTAPETEGTYTVAASSLSGDQTTWVRVKRNIRVDVNPSTATLAPGESLLLTTLVTGNNKTVTWSVAEGTEAGTITAAGVYTAPEAPGTYSIVATSASNPSRSDRATITVADAPQAAEPAPTVTIAVSPQTAALVAGSTLQFTATVTGSTDVGVTWSVAESGGGSVSATGLYTPPPTAGTYHVLATSNADPSKTSSASVTVSSPTVSKPVISSFTASPSSITQGASSTLSWTVSGEASLTINGGVGPVTGLSSKSVTPSATTTYTLTATNAAGSVTATAAVSVNAAALPALPPGVVPAFPGAQGGGALSKGGRGGAVIEVTNLNDSGPGSLRACVAASGPRTCVFRVSGTINLLSHLTVTNPYLTIAGQTAPGGGIQLSGKNICNMDRLFGVATHDVVVRYLRIRKGYCAATPLNGGGNVSIYSGAYNVMIDRCSIYWSQDENVVVWGGGYPAPRSITASWNIIAEPFTSSFGVGAATRELNDAMTDIDLHHNYIANSSHRNPLAGNSSLRIVNNLMYNYGFYGTQVSGGIRVDVIGNSYKPGPLGPPQHEVTAYPAGYPNTATGSPSMYVSGNMGPSNGDPSTDGWSRMVYQVTQENGAEIGVLPTTYRRTAPLPPAGVAIVAESALTLDASLLPTVGASQRLDCTGNWVMARDAADARVVRDYYSLTGTKPSTEDQVGGFPAMAPGTACADADHDGMPDSWEALRGLNPNNASDGSWLNADGFTNLEHYLNGQ